MGVHNGARRIDDPKVLDECRTEMAMLWDDGEEIAAYFARELAPLPRPRTLSRRDTNKARLRLAVPAGYLTLAILTPLPLAALGSGVVMALALLVPQATDLRLGASGNWLPRIGALPALLLFLIVAWFPDIDIALVRLLRGRGRYRRARELRLARLEIQPDHSAGKVKKRYGGVCDTCPTGG